MTDTLALTIVAPCYNEEAGLAAFVARMTAAADAVAAAEAGGVAPVGSPTSPTAI